MAGTPGVASSGARPPAPLPRRGPVATGRPPFRDNTRLLLVGIVVLLAVFAGLLVLAGRSSTLAADFLTDFVLYALSATNLMMLVALAFVLARNIVKLVVERRRALPFARFRAKLVALLLGMTLVPAVLVLIVGSEVIRNSVDRWFNAPMDEVLASANAIAGDYYAERQRLLGVEASRVAGRLADIDLATATPEAVRALVTPEVVDERLGAVSVFRIVGDRASVSVEPVVDVAGPVPAGAVASDTATLALRAARAGEPVTELAEASGGGDVIRTAALVPTAGGSAGGIVVGSDYLAGAFADRARSMTVAYEDYQQLRVLRQPLAGVYVSFFLMLTLMILVAATWMGLYLAKRITRPVQLLAAAAREIGAGRFDYRVVPETADEFGTLVEAFNSMAGEVAANRRRLERSTVDLERQHRSVEARRRHMETILDRLASGVVSIDARGRVRSANAAAARLLGDGALAGAAVAAALGRPGLEPLRDALDDALARGQEVRPTDVTVRRDDREVHLAVMAAPLPGEGDDPGGFVLVLDDVTPLVRAQRVAAWREVARRLAHEIKNPLTPIQLCAERVRRHFAGAPAESKALVEECTTTIVGEVESLKDLVDEFSQFARMPAPRMERVDVAALVDDVLGLYRGLFSTVEVRRRVPADLPPLSADREQVRRVLINLIDNAVEAMDRKGVIEVEAAHDPAARVLRLIVADDGPGIPAEERDKLFLPYYSTKRRGSGVGLAIVRRIVAEHGGAIDVADHHPRGTRFTIELPC
jgi:two-component system nitrogen regulation sensor histidine kinase NtrY